MRKFSIKTALAIAILVIAWGLSWPIYKNALPYTPPILFAGMRALLGGLLLTILLLPMWRKMKWRENWKQYCLSALLNAVLFYGLQTIGLTYLPEGLFSVLVYFQPVLIGIFAWILLGEQMTRMKVIGLIIGFLGILTISSDGLNGKISILGIVLALSSAFSWALGTVYVKKVSKQVDALWMVALQFTIGGIVLTGIGAGIEDFTEIVWNSHYIFALCYAATIGIPLAFVLYFTLINSGDSSKVASFTFLVPLIAVLVGTLFMDEPFTLSLFFGLILIVLSIGFVNYTNKKKINLLQARVEKLKESN